MVSVEFTKEGTEHLLKSEKIVNFCFNCKICAAIRIKLKEAGG